MKKVLALAMVLVLAFVLVACGGGGGTPAPAPSGDGGGGAAAPAADAGYRSEINIAVDVDAETYIPVLWKNTTAQRVGMLIYDGLVYIDENLVPQPALATSWDNPDETTWVFHLREGVKFHDGREFTAADVKYTYEQILNPDNNPPYISRYNSIESLEIIDPYTIQFNLNKPFAPILVYLDLGIMPENAMDDPGFAVAPIGTGVYKVTNYVLNSITKLEAFEEYWGDKAATPTVNVHIINDNSVRIASLQAGDVDFICSPLTATDLPVVENDPNLSFNKIASLGITYMGFSVSHPVLSDLAVRQAIAYMVNKESIAKNFYSGMDTPGATPLQYISWAWTDSLHGYEYNPEKAVAVLEEAGWIDTNGDGVREKNGQDLAFTLSTHTDDTSRFQVVEYMQNQLTGIGMKVDVSVTEWAVFSADMLAHKTEVWVAGWLNLFDPDRMHDMFHSDSPSAYGDYHNARVDELLNLGRTNSDRAARAAAYQEVAQIVTDEVYYVTLLDQAYICIYNNKMENYVVFPTGSIYSMRYCKIAK